MSDENSENPKSEADINLFKFLKKKKVDDKDGKITGIPKRVDETPNVEPRDCENYGMSNYKRGKALIFNHYSFNDRKLSNREGTHEDCLRITSLLESLHFDVMVYSDLEFGKIYGVLKEVSHEDHTSNDCIVIVVLTHGNTGRLHAKDTDYSPDDLWIPFTGDKCKGLAGKPKLVFIQTSNGQTRKPRVRNVECDSVAKSKTFKIPAMADFLVMYASVEDSLETGSSFIGTLCKEMSNRYKKQDVLSILTFVNRCLMQDEMKPVVTLVSSLTRLMYFYESKI